MSQVEVLGKHVIVVKYDRYASDMAIATSWSESTPSAPSWVELDVTTPWSERVAMIDMGEI